MYLGSTCVIDRVFARVFPSFDTFIRDALFVIIDEASVIQAAEIGFSFSNVIVIRECLRRMLSKHEYYWQNGGIVF